jgi:hypothetical protein
MDRPSKEVVDHALVMVDNHVRAFPTSVVSFIPLAAEVRALRDELEKQRAKYRRDLINHSCNSPGGPDACGGCCECMQRQFEHGTARHDDTVDKLREELRQWKEGEVCLRDPECECHQEEGDDECPVHDAQNIVRNVKALCDMQHDDRLIRVGDIRAALRGDNG